MWPSYLLTSWKVWPQHVTVYQTGDRVEQGTFNLFLDAIDGSYCSYAGGDTAG